MMKKSPFLLLCALLLATGCGRYFGGIIQPLAKSKQAEHMVVQDDRSVTYVFERLEVGLLPMSDGELNRQFPTNSNKGAVSTNPYTYGNWRRMGEEWIPPRYSVWRLRIKNYAYPKIQVDPRKIELISNDGHRRYRTLEHEEIVEYYYSQVVGYGGNAYKRFRAREDILNRTMFKGEALFSGQEAESYVVFPALDSDVTSFAVHINDVAVRFNYTGEPVETIDLTFQFEREVHKGYHPPEEWLSELQ